MVTVIPTALMMTIVASTGIDPAPSVHAQRRAGVAPCPQGPTAYRAEVPEAVHRALGQGRRLLRGGRGGQCEDELLDIVVDNFVVHESALKRSPLT